MRLLLSSLLAAVVCSASPAFSQMEAPHHTAAASVPLRLTFSVPANRPPASTRQLLAQTGAGILSGAVGAAVGVLAVTLVSSGTERTEALPFAAMAGSLAGMPVGIHYAGRRQGTRGNPLATGAGILGGVALSGMVGNYVVAGIAGSAGGTFGYSLTRRAR
jgi:ABC-type cobalamin transport system permease subunit